MSGTGIVSDDLSDLADEQRTQTIVTRTFQSAASSYQRQIDRAVSNNEPLTVFLTGVREVHGLRDLLPALGDQFMYMSTAGVEEADLNGNAGYEKFQSDLKARGIEIDKVMLTDTETTKMGVAIFSLHRSPG